VSTFLPPGVPSFFQKCTNSCGLSPHRVLCHLSTTVLTAYKNTIIIIIIIIIIIKLFPCLTKHAMKAYWGNGGIAPRIH
jgi:hypothetical protein